MKFRPLANRVIIEPLKAEDQVVGGLVISAKTLGEAVLRGIVRAAGPETTLKVGDTVAFGRYGFDEIKDGAKTYYVMPDVLVLTTIEEDAVPAVASTDE